MRKPKKPKLTNREFIKIKKAMNESAKRVLGFEEYLKSKTENPSTLLI